ncbi:MAG: hypothetical protein IJE62_00620 [Clostridia bacterium]|nr:hypothetical protein [Clostridia bacterium]
MVDYQKLYIDLFNKFSELIDTLEEIQDKSFAEFNSSYPTKEDVKYFIRNVDFGKSKRCTFK